MGRICSGNFQSSYQSQYTSPKGINFTGKCTNQKAKTLVLYTIEVYNHSVIISSEIEEYLKNYIA